MTRTRSIAGALFATTTVVAACYDESPDQTVDLATEDLSLRVTAHARVGATDVELWFSPPESAGRIRFSVGDRLSLRSDDVSVSPARDPQGTFFATLPADAPTLSVILDRTEEENGIVDIALLPPANLSVPPVASRDAPLEIAWTTSGELVAQTTITVVGTCFTTVTRQITGDPGAYLLQPADFAPTATTCTAEATLDRSLKRAEPSTPFAEVQLDLSRSDRVTWESTP